MTVLESYWRLAAWDIANSDGICVVTLKSGVQLEGTVQKHLSDKETLSLLTIGGRGWHVIDYQEVAAMTGRPRTTRDY